MYGGLKSKRLGDKVIDHRSSFNLKQRTPEGLDTKYSLIGEETTMEGPPQLNYLSHFIDRDLIIPIRSSVVIM